jgi:hypothetical protein
LPISGVETLPNRNAAKGWIAVIVAEAALTAAGFTASFPIASECSTPQELHWWIAAPFFAIYAVAGTYVTAVGTRAQRLLLFVGTVLTVAGYVGGLSLTLPTAFETEISCAAAGER